MLVPSLKTYAAYWVASNLENPFLKDKLHSNTLPEELLELILNIFERDIKENQILVFGYGLKFDEYLSNNKIPSYDTNLYENLRLELIKIGIIKKTIILKNDSKKLLFAASSNGNLQTVKFLKDNGADVNASDNNDRIGRMYISKTSLMLAAQMGHLDVVQYLIENGADINARNNYGETALIYAAQKGHLKIVQYLIDKKFADINARNNYGETALMYAAQKGYLKIMECLINNNADIDTRDAIGRTALRIAEVNGHLETVKYLIDKGADIV